MRVKRYVSGKNLLFTLCFSHSCKTKKSLKFSFFLFFFKLKKLDVRATLYMQLTFKLFDIGTGSFIYFLVFLTIFPSFRVSFFLFAAEIEFPWKGTNISLRNKQICFVEIHSTVSDKIVRELNLLIFSFGYSSMRNMCY